MGVASFVKKARQTWEPASSFVSLCSWCWTWCDQLSQASVSVMDFSLQWWTSTWNVSQISTFSPWLVLLGCFNHSNRHKTWTGRKKNNSTKLSSDIHTDTLVSSSPPPTLDTDKNDKVVKIHYSSDLTGLKLYVSFTYLLSESMSSLFPATYITDPAHVFTVHVTFLMPCMQALESTIWRRKNDPYNN